MRSKRLDDSEQVKKFTRAAKLNWQVYFLPAMLLYGISLGHFFNVRPLPADHSVSFVNGLDQLSFVLAIVLLLTIFNMKRRYFSGKFSRVTVDKLLKESSATDAAEILKKVLAVILSKLRIVWILGMLLVIEGVLYYWFTFTDRNMHIYFIGGTFSLLVNYPRADLFSDIPWYVRQELKDK